MWSLPQKPQPILCNLKKSRTMPKQSRSSAIPPYAGIWPTPLGNTKRPCLILQKNRIATKQTAPQRDLPECSAAISRRSSPSLRAMPGCLSQITLFSMWQPSVPAKKLRSWSSGCTMYPLWGCSGLISLRVCVLVMHRRNAKSAKSGF